MECNCGSDDGPETNASGKRNAGIQLDEQNKYFENIVPKGPTAMETVERHNKAFPCMEDELDKKRSVADTTNRQLPTAKYRQQHRYNAACKACMRLKALNDIEKYDVKPRCERRELENKGENKEPIKKKLTPSRKRKHNIPVVIRSLTDNTNDENIDKDNRQNRKDKKKTAEKRKTPVGSLCNICRKKLKRDGAHRCRELNKGIRKAASGVSTKTNSKTLSEGSISRYSGESSIGPELSNEPMD